MPETPYPELKDKTEATAANVPTFEAGRLSSTLQLRPASSQMLHKL